MEALGFVSKRNYGQSTAIKIAYPTRETINFVDNNAHV